MTTPGTNKFASALRHAIFIAALAGLGGCSSIPKAPLDASLNPTQQIQRLDVDIQKGYSDHFDITDNKDFTKAQKELAKAKSQADKGKPDEEIRDTLGYAQAYFNRAQERNMALHDRMKGIFDARTAALSAGVRNFHDLAAELKSHDDDVRAEVKNIDNGRTSAARWDYLQRGYLALELKSVQDTKLGQSRAKIERAVRDGAKKKTPNMLTAAQRDLINAENVIAANLHNEEAIEPAVAKANFSAQLLAEVLAKAEGPEGPMNEDAALALVRQERHIKELSQRLQETTGTASQSLEELKQEKEKMKEAKQTLSLSKALDDARHKFDPSEAEVYRQGDKLLIRLKAMNFPVNRADLPEASLPLLSKVKSIAEELNPTQVVVEGHTDATGSKATNMALSQKRAEAVATYLESNGIESDKIQPTGYGDTKPIVTNKTKEGRAQNRRVDVIITPSTPTSGDSKSL